MEAVENSGSTGKLEEKLGRPESNSLSKLRIKKYGTHKFIKTEVLKGFLKDGRETYFLPVLVFDKKETQLCRAKIFLQPAQPIDQENAPDLLVNQRRDYNNSQVKDELKEKLK
ncbi:hypothetical protein DAPPUDRAFT_313579 [Daphnia pulex]|uniref:Uncharacterized protein n=1 Tax=Daphnia pulex TaxID=6669 RepID=E9G3I8_DAPPU|nr:hypothetical protein DAPPUDRAFT_313579 [Daphnia pulex]|eukprot:EFX85980.1 hypothetical protein DAPPUDRAFT_313579 [Daphnia pulex]